MPDRAELAAALTRTEAVVTELVEKVDIQSATLRRGKAAITLGLFGLVLDLTLTVVLGLGWLGLTSNQDRISALHVAQQQETDRNKASTCAIVTLFLQLEPKTKANPSYTPEQHALQEQAYGTLRQIGEGLGCPNQ